MRQQERGEQHYCTKRMSKPTQLNQIIHTKEYVIWKTILQNNPLYIMGIYHHLPSNNITNAIFIDEITEILANRTTKYNNMVILGDLNIHIDDLANTDSHMFNDTMQAFGFKQHVISPTHKCRHTLDLIYIKINTELTQHNCILHGLTTHSKKHHGQPLKKTIRDTTKLTRKNLEQNYTPPVIVSNASLKQACNQFIEGLHKMLDRAAPQRCEVYRQTTQILVQ